MRATMVSDHFSYSWSIYASVCSRYLGAGVQWHGAYDETQAYGRLVVGGHSIGESVGAAGGWILGGGHSALSPAFGLGW